jgi:hypothetical protein
MLPVDIDWQQDAAAVADNVKAAAAMARHVAFDAMYDNCSSHGCQSNHMTAMHTTTQQLQATMEQLQLHYKGRQLVVPAPIQARAASMAQVTTRVGALTAKAQSLRDTSETTHMLLEGVRLVGQWTHGALTAAEDAAIMHKNRKWHNRGHASFKIKLLRQGGQCSGQQPFFMC